MTHSHQTAIVVLTAVIFSFDNLREKRLQPSTSQSRTACLKNSYSTQRLKITNVVTSPRPQQTHTFFLSPRPKPLCTCSDKQNLIWDPQGITLNPGHHAEPRAGWPAGCAQPQRSSRWRGAQCLRNTPVAVASLPGDCASQAFSRLAPGDGDHCGPQH